MSGNLDATTHEWGLGFMSGRAASTNLSACSPVVSVLSALSSVLSTGVSELSTGASSVSLSSGMGLPTLSVIIGFSSISGVTGWVAIGASKPFDTGFSIGSGAVTASVPSGCACTADEVSTISLIIGLGSSLVGVTDSALGGVMLKKLLSIPTAGGRPRGRLRLSDTLAFFSTRQSDHDNRFGLPMLLVSNG